jgi:hypothetical protein
MLPGPATQTTLKRLCGVQMELPIIHLHRGSWALPVTLDFLQGQGFILSQIAAVSYSKVNVTFRRANPEIDFISAS